MRGRVWWVLWASMLLVPIWALAEPMSVPVPAEGEAELSARLEQVKTRATHEAVRAPAEQAALALGRARDPKLDASARQRSLEIARAAVALAEARALLLAERALHQRALARKQSAQRARGADAGP